MKTFFVLAVLLISQFAMANIDRKGNGGDAIICADKTYLYDYYELLELYNVPPFFGFGMTFEEKFKYLISRIDRVDPSRAEKYKKWYDEFWAETRQLYGRSLVDIPDTGAGWYPAGCRLVQTIIQIVPQTPQEKRYTVDMDTWNLLDDDSKLGFYIHEFILRDAIISGHENSVATRNYHSVLVSQTSLPTDLYSYIAMLRELGFKFYEFRGFPLDVDSMEFLVQYSLSKARVSTSKIKFFSNDISVEYLSLKSYEIFERVATFVGQGLMEYKSANSSGRIYFSEVSVTERETDMTLKISDKTESYLSSKSLRGYQLTLKPGSEALFYENGIIKQVTAKEALVYFNGSWQDISDKTIIFSEDGEIADIR